MTNPMTLSVLLKKINRRLEKSDQRVRKTRGAKARQELGDYYVEDFNRNTLVAWHVDPEALGQELGILQAGETLADSEEDAA